MLLAYGILRVGARASIALINLFIISHRSRSARSRLAHFVPSIVINVVNVAGDSRTGTTDKSLRHSVGEKGNDARTPWKGKEEAGETRYEQCPAEPIKQHVHVS